MTNPFERPRTYDPKIEDILYWVAERENIRVAKEQGASRELWTADPILQKYRFCNVRRRDDRMSRWMIRNLFTPYKYNDGEDMWFISAIARYINWPPTLMKLLAEGMIPAFAQDFDPHGFVEILNQIKTTGEKTYGSAYMLYPGRETGSNKAETIAYRFLLPLVEGREQIREAVASKRVEAVVTELTKYYGWNTFLAGQVAADLTYCPGELDKAIDLYEWAPIGPGSSRGLNRLFGRAIGHWHQGQFNEALRVIWQDLTEQLDLDEFTLHDCQNVMCELDKMWRGLAGEGAPRSLYVAETAY